MGEKILYVKLSGSGNPDYDEPRDIGVPTEWRPVRDWADASRIVRSFIDRWNLGGGNWTGGEIRQGSSTGKIIAHVSYNGRVWSGSRRSSTKEILYS